MPITIRGKLLSQCHPALYAVSVWEKRTRTWAKWLFGRERFARARAAEPLSHRVMKHQSVLIRKLGDSDVQLQRNKVRNLELAAARLDGVLIRPGETLSFCRLVGLPTRRKGYLEGMELSFGEARPGIGGGICQIANLLHWLALHSPLTVAQRSNHSFDPFPDDGRVLPFGSGAAVFYNYVDFKLRNDTERTFQIRLWIGPKCLEGELRCDAELGLRYHVFERAHEFLKIGDAYFRKNEIWREAIRKGVGGKPARGLGSELLIRNFARVMYRPESFRDCGDANVAAFRRNWLALGLASAEGGGRGHEALETT